MKLWRQLRGGFRSDTTTTTVKITQDLPWYWRSTQYSVLVAVFIAGGVGLFQQGRVEGEQRAMAAIREVLDARTQHDEMAAKLVQLELENENLNMSLVKVNSDVQMSQSSQIDLTHALAQLQEDYSRLNAELAFLQKVTANNDGQSGLNLSDFAIERAAVPNTYRYRALLMLGGRPSREFQGHAELLVTIERKGQIKILSMADLGQQKNIVKEVKFKYYQRLEGSFQVAAGMVVKSVQLRIFEKGSAAPRLTRTYNP